MECFICWDWAEQASQCLHSTLSCLDRVLFVYLLDSRSLNVVWEFNCICNFNYTKKSLLKNDERELVCDLCHQLKDSQLNEHDKVASTKICLLNASMKRSEEMKKKFSTYRVENAIERAIEWTSALSSIFLLRVFSSNI